MDKYTDLLAKISENCEKFSHYTSLSEYNIFNVLNITAKEVIMCRFLADLLNPEGQHACGILFLKSFLQDILKEYRMSDKLLAHTDVFTEYGINDERRIDIVIQNAYFLIPIEVKIYADEQEGQCYDYYENAKNAPIVYLTRFGDIPSEYSRKKKGGTDVLSLDNIQCISWKDDICNWLTGLLVQLKEPIKSIVMQFIDGIHVFTDERGIAMEKNLEVLYESPEYFSAGIEIEKAMKTAKSSLIRLVFDDFKEEMKTVASKYGLELEEDANYYVYDEKCNEKFYDGNNTTCPGLNYIVKNAKFQEKNSQMWFRIEVEHNLFAGITIFDTNAKSKDEFSRGYEVDEITEQMIEQIAQYLDRDIIAPINWWVTWCYPNGKRQDAYYDDVPDFKHMNQCAISLVDKETRKKFVKNAVKTFEDHILKHLLNGQL